MKFTLASIFPKQSWMYLSFGITIVLASIVIAGWLLNIPSMVQIDENSVPMQFNTALCLLGIAVSGITLHKRCYRLTVLICIFTFLIALLTLLQYALDINLYIDELVVTHSITTHTSSPGRMAPNSAVCFLLGSICLMWLAVKYTRASGITIISGTISLILVFSLLSILGYVFSIKTSYGWGNMTYMALQTAIGCLSFSIGILLLIVFHRQRTNGSIYYVPIVLGMVFLMVTLLFTNQLNNNKNNSQDPILKLKRVLVNDDIKLKWNMELLLLAENLQNIVQSTELNRQPYPMPQSFIAMYVENLQGDISIVYQNPEYAVFEVLANQHRYYSAIDNSIARTLGIKTTDLFMLNGRQSLLLKMQPNDSLNRVNANISSVIVRVNIEQFLQTIVAPILSNQDQIIISPKASNIAEINGATTIKWPFYTESSKFSIQFGESEFSASQSRLVYLVFCFGLFITMTLVIITFFGQRSIYQSRSLLKQARAKEAYEIEMQQSHLTLKLAADVAKLGIWSWDVESGELIWNARMYEIYNTPDEVIKTGLLFDYWYQSVCEEDRDRANDSLQQAVANKQNWEQEFRLSLPGGIIKYIKATAICFTDNSKQSMLVIGGNLDVTQEKMLQQELEAQTKQAEMDSLAKSQFLANMSHELRTPMNGVLGIGELLACTNLNAKQHLYLETMMSSAEKLLALLNDILDISKIEAGEMQLDIICVPFEEVVAENLKSLANSAHQKGLDYHYQKQQNVPEWVYTDPIRLGQILVNIVGNAIKFTESGEITINIGIDSATPSKHDAIMVMFEVSDSGIGMSSDDLKTVFSPFMQADQSITRRYGGTGLGLSIVQELVRMLDGSLEIESAEGKGTCVRFNIPMKIGTRKEGDAHANPEHDYYLQNSMMGLDNVNCMVVDGNEINRQWINDMLHSWNCNVTSCADGTTGLHLWEQGLESGKAFDALIIDNNIKGVEAFDFIQLIHKLNANKKIARPATVFVMTSKNLQANLTRCAELNIKQHILKPVKQSEVFNALMTALGKKQETRIDPKIISVIDTSQQLNVLVAEDHPVNQMLVRDILDSRGHSVKIVETGRMVLSALEEEQFDAILMDVQMPEMDGITATQLIRKGNNQADICIIGLTAKALKEDKLTCIDAGMNYYLTKPIKPSLLLDVLENREIRDAQLPSDGLDTNVKSITTADFTEYLVLSVERSMLSTGGDLVLLRKLLKLTSDNILPTLKQIRNLNSQNNWPALAKEVHKSKGMLANFCDPDFVETMELLIEQAEQVEHDNDDIARLVLTVVLKIETFSEELTDFMTKSAKE